MREHLERPIQDGEGTLLVDSRVRLLEPGTTTEIPETVYLAATGEEVLENPWVTPDGVIDFYLAYPRRVRIGVTPPGAIEEIFFEDVAVGDEEVYKETFSFTLAGPLSAQTGSLRFYVEDASEILQVRVAVGVPSDGADVVVDVNKNGVSVFSDQATRPRVLVGEYTGISIPQDTTLAVGDYLTIDIDQVGTTVAGADLVIQVRVRRTAQ